MAQGDVAPLTEENLKKAGAANVPEVTSAWLMEVAAVETRMRQYTLELMEPTIQRSSALEDKLKKMQATLDQHSQEMEAIMRVKSAAEMQIATVEGFREELSRWDVQRRSQEAKVEESLSLKTHDINALRATLEVKTSEFKGLGRTVTKLGDIVDASKEEHNKLRQYCIERIDTSRDKLYKLRDEFETRMTAAETETHALKDVQCSIDSGIGHLTAELKRLDSIITEHGEGIVQMQKGKAPRSSLDALQSEMTEFIRQTNGNVASLKQHLSSLVGDVKSHFETAANVVGTSTAQHIDEMRKSYLKEIKRIDSVKIQIEAFMKEQLELQSKLSSDVDSAVKTTEAKVGELSGTLQTLGDKRVLDRKNMDIEITNIRKNIQNLEGNRNDKGVMNLQGVMNCLLECERVTSALDKQDDEDRKNVALFGYKDAADFSLPEIDNPGYGINTMGGKKKKKSLIQGNHPMTVDQRCLSCSGSSATALAGFKMACLQYFPGPVEYEKTSYNRTDLIQIRHNLIEQAREQLKHQLGSAQDDARALD
jgi:hypothetical protein